MHDFLLARNNAGRLVLTTAQGVVHEGITPVRAFPVTAPDKLVAIMSAEGKEILWIDDPAELPEDVRTLIQAEIASRELMPEIMRILSVSSFSTPCTWDVETDRGKTTFVLKGEEDIRRQKLNVFNMKTMGATVVPVTSGSRITALAASSL